MEINRQDPSGFMARWTAIFTRPVPNLLLRTGILVVGLVFIAAGVALSRATGMGTSPISCVPAVLSFMTDWSVGTYTFILNTFFVLIQLVLLRRDFGLAQILQLPATFVFSALIDLLVPFAELIPMPNYAACVAVMLVSVLCTAVGVFYEVKATLVTLPGEGVSTTVSRVANIPFPTCKLGFDVSNVVLGVVLSLVVMGGLYGVREGTVLAALAVGPLVRVLNKLLPSMELVVPTKAPGLILATPNVAPERGAQAAAEV